MGATEEIARFVVNTDPNSIPGEALNAVRENCFDGAGVILAGASQPVGKIITRFVRNRAGAPEATVLGGGFRTSAPDAALANGTMGHALDYDDLGGHVTSYMLPALLALGEQRHVSGKDIMVAYAMGFEVGETLRKACRFIETLRGFHGMAVWGNMMATAACGRLLGLTVEKMVMAFGIAGSGGCGVAQNFGTMGKPLHAGLVARNAVTSVLLATEGFVAADNILESPVGYLHSHVGEGAFDLSKTLGSLGQHWSVAKTTAIKKYPCCGSNHSMLDGILSLRAEHGFTFDDVERVEVYGVPYLSHVLLYPEPKIGLNGKFSLHYNAAAAILDGRIDIETYRDEKARSEEMKEALKKVRIHVDSLWDSIRGRATANPVKIYLKDGRVLTRAVNRWSMKGTRADPLSKEQLEAKFLANANRVLSSDQARQAAAIWYKLDELEDISLAASAIGGA